ncbi:MAG: L-galactonate-5-dehydrogenase [Verrucomicrobia subdivision 3 bacterium]|nr:L-galactonate-5-dehydrogenase [Limisphaerales bacterium]MCS1412641.1 L-galactonate-5-dehydrogenase [Limisphaerales bacterium]
MKAIVLEAPKKFSIAEIAPPKPLRADEALIRVHRVGVCGTDISGYLGRMPFFNYPVIPGHELGVEVLAVGESVTNVKPGDQCSVEPYMNNPESFSSRLGRSNCCENLEVLGVHTDGGLRPEFVVPARKLHVATKMTYEQLALVETLAIGCHAVDRGAAREGENVLVIGAGPIGLSVIEFARVAKAKITLLDLNEQRLRFCKETMGVDRVIQGKESRSDLRELERMTDGGLFTLVLDATGSNRSMSQAVNYVGHTGRLVFVGITTQEVGFYHPLVHCREMTLLSSRNALPKDFSRVIQLIEEGVIDTRPWITHRSGFEELVANFPSYTLPETGVIKAIVEVS